MRSRAVTAASFRAISISVMSCMAPVSPSLGGARSDRSACLRCICEAALFRPRSGLARIASTPSNSPCARNSTGHFVVKCQLNLCCGLSFDLTAARVAGIASEGALPVLRLLPTSSDQSPALSRRKPLVVPPEVQLLTILRNISRESRFHGRCC